MKTCREDRFTTPGVLILAYFIYVHPLGIRQQSQLHVVNAYLLDFQPLQYHHASKVETKK
jgi:hypothetical protein